MIIQREFSKILVIVSTVIKSIICVGPKWMLIGELKFARGKSLTSVYMNGVVRPFWSKSLQNGWRERILTRWILLSTLIHGNATLVPFFLFKKLKQTYFKSYWLDIIYDVLHVLYKWFCIIYLIIGEITQRLRLNRRDNINWMCR